jgi:hypothetical protein
MSNQYTIPQLVEENDEHIIYDVGAELTPQDYGSHKKFHSIVTRFLYNKQDNTASCVTTYEEEGEHLPLAASNRLIPISLWQAITGHKFKTEAEYKAKLALLRNVVVEHNLVVTATGEKLSAKVCDGGLWGDDFDNLASSNPEDPFIYKDVEGRTLPPEPYGRPVTFTQVFLRTTKTDEQLLQEYK